MASGRSLAFVLAAALAACGQDERPDDAISAPNPPDIPLVMAAGEALAGAHVPTVDPATMRAAEIEKVLGPGPRCEFRYTSSARPALALLARPQADAAAGVVKLNGSLVPLEASGAGEAAIALSAGPVQLTLSAEGARRWAAGGDACLSGGRPPHRRL